MYKGVVKATLLHRRREAKFTQLFFLLSSFVAFVNFHLASYSIELSNFDAAMHKAFNIELDITVKELATFEPGTPQRDSRVVYHDWLLKNAPRWKQVRRRDDRNRRECKNLKDEDFFHFSEN